MSLLEDVFLEDEAGEAQELERVIEGDDYDERPRYDSGSDSNNNSEKEDEAEEEKRRVDPATTKTKKVVKNPRFILNPARLTGPRGIRVIPDHFKDFKFKGKGHEKEDLDLVLKKLEHWAYRLYPKFKFEDCLKKIETLGKKRPVLVHLQKIRSDQLTSDETVVQRDSSDDETPPVAPEEDEFDRLLQQQIELARSTPAPNSVKKTASTPIVDNRSPLSMPKAISSPSISDEQKERIMRNRKLAEEKRLARLKNNSSSIDLTTNSVINEGPIVVEDFGKDNLNKSIDLINNNSNITVLNEVPITVEDHVPIDIDEPKVRKHNRTNVIDSSDDECEEIAVNQSVTVDIHNTRYNDVEMNSDKENNDIIEGNETCNDIEIDDIMTERVSKNTAKNKGIENETDHLVHDEVINDNNDITEEVNNTSKDRELIENNSENNAIDKCVDKIDGITENINNRNKSNDEDSDIESVNDEVNIINSTSNAPDAQIDKQNNSIEFNRIESVINISNRETNNGLHIESSISKVSNEHIDKRNDFTESKQTDIVNKKSNNDFDNVNDEVNIASSGNFNAQIDNNSLQDESAKVTECNKNLDNKEQSDSPSNNKENIDNNVEVDLMDVDFSDDF